MTSVAHGVPDVYAKDAWLDRPISLFRGSTNTTPVDQVSLSTILTRIQDGTYRQATAHLRHLYASGDEGAYKAAKDRSVALTPCCALHTRSKDVAWPDKLIS